MTTSRINFVSLIVSIIGVVFALPGFINILFGERTGLGILSALVGVIILGVAWWLRRFLGQPDFTILSAEKALKFEDKEAHKVTHTCTQTIKANHKGLTEFWFRGMTADGSIQNIRINNKEPDLEQTQSGQKEVCKRFPDGLQRGEEARLAISLEAIDSFTDNPDHFIHRVSTKTKNLRLRVEFHPGMPYRYAKAYLQYGGQKHKPLEQLKRYDNAIELEIKKPRLGEEYRLEWHWMLP